jgi:hypothetical protein
MFGIVHCRTMCSLAILMQIMYNGKNVEKFVKRNIAKTMPHA